MNNEWTRLQPLLRPGEKLRWAGRPDPSVRFAPADKFMVPFSLLWCGFAVFWESQAITREGSFFFILWGIPFVLIGLYFVFGRFFYKKRRKLKTVYGLTDSRAIVSTSERSFQDTSLKGTAIQTVRSRDGRHTSVFFGSSRNPAYQNTGLDFLNFGTAQGIGFFDVADPEVLSRELDQVR